jgi:hypothetical protein
MEWKMEAGKGREDGESVTAYEADSAVDHSSALDNMTGRTTGKERKDRKGKERKGKTGKEREDMKGVASYGLVVEHRIIYYNREEDRMEDRKEAWKG